MGFLSASVQDFPDISQGMLFLETLAFGDEDREFSFQIFADDKGTSKEEAHKPKVFHGTFAKFHRRLVLENRMGAGVFVTANQTNLKGRKIGDIVCLRAIYGDFDGVIELPAFPIEPSIIVKTKRGFHCYWLLLPDQSFDRYLVALRILIKHFGADPKVDSINEVLRVPGFFHQKDPASPFQIQLLKCSATRYSVDEFLAAFPMPPPRSEVKPARVTSSYGTGTLPFSGFTRVLAGCEALERIVDRGREMVLGHAEGLSLLSHVQKFAGGPQWFLENIKGWGATSGDQYEIEHFLNQGYSPYSCKKMIDLGVCALHPEACFKSRWDGGKFRSPNPIRFAFTRRAPGKCLRNIIKKWGIS